VAGAGALDAAAAGPWAWAVALALVPACAALAWSRPASGARGSPAESSDVASGTRLMAREVVPVWRRQLEAARSNAESELQSLVQAFSSLSGNLSAAAELASKGPQGLGVGAVDELLDRSEQPLDELLQPVHELARQREAMLHELGGLNETLSTLRDAVKEIGAIASRGNLVAMNASIEANRAGQAQGGFGAVAREVRALSSRTQAVASDLRQRLTATHERLEQLRRDGELARESGETLRLAARQRARAVIAMLMGDMGGAVQSSRELRELSTRLGEEMDGLFQGFQFHDRLNQMLTNLQDDMDRFAAWMAEGRPASHTDAAQWLQRLEDTYTMAEQRAHHHGNVQIERASGVEFF
jgi:methyl-accepting chemotaxis protein